MKDALEDLIAIVGGQNRAAVMAWADRWVSRFLTRRYVLDEIIEQARDPDDVLKSLEQPIMWDLCKIIFDTDGCVRKWDDHDPNLKADVILCECAVLRHTPAK